MTSRVEQIAAHVTHEQPAIMAKTPTDIHLYTSLTPNGIKISILLEELGLEYKA